MRLASSLTLTRPWASAEYAKRRSLHVEHDRHRAVVHDLHRHPRPEHAGLDVDAERAKLVAEALVQRLGLLRTRGSREARPVALRRVFVPSAVWVGVDVGGSRASTAVVAVTKDLRVADVRVFDGNEAVLHVPDALLELARRFDVREVAYDRGASRARRSASNATTASRWSSSRSRTPA
jgi:hypothetical protein